MVELSAPPRSFNNTTTRYHTKQSRQISATFASRRKRERGGGEVTIANTTMTNSTVKMLLPTMMMANLIQTFFHQMSNTAVLSLSPFL